MSAKTLLRVATIASGFAVAVLVGCIAFPKSASAAVGDPGPFGTRLNYGYFDGGRETSGTRVIPTGVHSNDVNQFVADIRSWIYSPDLNYQTGSRFIVNTMLQRDVNAADRNVTLADLAEWEMRVRAMPSINFDEPYSFCTNSYYQRNVNDAAFYRTLNGSCWTPNDTIDGLRVGNSIVFRDSFGTIVYAIRRACGNPVGQFSIPGLPRANYTLQPNVAVSPGSNVEPGQTLTFTMTLNNPPGSGRASDPATCTVYSIQRPGYVAGLIAPGPGDPATPVACPSIAPNNTFTVAVHTIPNVGSNTYCRLLVVSPASQAGGSAQHEACVVVVSKPYAKVFGGDVAAGSGFGASCTEDNNAGIVGWNQRTNGVGSGTQFAAFALNVLQDFASSQVNTGIARPPTGLSFSNQGTNAAAGAFGTTFGLNSLPCHPDYYGQKPTSGVTTLAGPIVDLDPLNTGAYSVNGSITIGGDNINPNKRVVLYVNGDVYINSNIQYTASWNPDSTPLFKLVVRGNIYIAGGVGRLDGVYIAQPSGAVGGTIYTCTNPASPFTALPLSNPGNQVFNLCTNKLVVNGSFTAQHIELLRTAGTLARSNVGESSGVNDAAEVFNFNPSLWIAQPPAGSSTSTSSDTYDSIVSLPPVL